MLYLKRISFEDSKDIPTIETSPVRFLCSKCNRWILSDPLFEVNMGYKCECCGEYDIYFHYHSLCGLTMDGQQWVNLEMNTKEIFTLGIEL